MSEIVECIAFVVQKTCWSLGIFAVFVAKRIADLFGLIFNILACLTIIRLPCMWMQFSAMDSFWEWRFIGFVHFIFFLIDIPFILMGTFMIIITCGLILIPFYKDIKKDRITLTELRKPKFGIYGLNLFQIHLLVASYFFRFICDVLCIPLAVICILSWRCCIFVKKMRKKDYSWRDFGWRKLCVQQFVQILVDIPCILIGMAVIVTWRAPFLNKRVRKKRYEDQEKWNEWRFGVFPEFFYIFVDFVCIVLFLITMVTWRAPMLCRNLYYAEKKQMKIREIIVKQALLIFVDIPCIVCFLVVFVSMWRIPNFIRNWKNSEWKIRENCIIQLVMLLLDFSCLVLSVFVVMSLWRLYPLITDIRKYWSRPREERSWKVRKSICKNFVFVFVDIPAIFLCFIILVTVFRFPKLLSKLIQTGNFFLEFALTVYFETAMLVVDIFFMLLFLVLMCLRPIQSWVHLLENEEHKKSRLLRHYMQWVPDIIEKRFEMRREMEGIFSTCLKNKKREGILLEHLTGVNEVFLEELEWIRDKVKKYELDEGFSHLINMAKWWEKKRVNKLVRLYRCELNFLLHPNVSTHNANLSKFRKEMIAFESHVSEQYHEIEKYSMPRVPLWSEQCGLLTRTRKETQKVLIKCLPSGRFVIIFLILLNLLFIYRGPTLLKNLWQRWYDRKRIVFASCWEYIYDFSTIFMILFVVIFLYRAPFLITDITRDIFFKQSWRAVRKTVKKYPVLIFEDIVNLIKSVLSWQTVRFLFTAFLFGLLMPADLFLKITKSLFPNCWAYFITSISYLFFMGFPFFLSFYISRKLEAATLTIVIGVFAFILLVCLVAMVVVLLKNKGDDSGNRDYHARNEQPLLIEPTPYDYVRFNWTNIHVIVFEIVEFLQLLALVFIISDIPMVGANTLNTASQYLLLNFASFHVKLWLTFSLFLIWFFCCGAPVIFETVLDHLPKGTCAKHVGWTLFLSLFANTLFVTFVESFLTFVACKSQDCSTINVTASTTSCIPVVLYDDQSIECWEGSHKAVAMLGLLGLMWYSTTAILFGTKYGDVDHPSQDLKFSPAYNIFINFIKALMVGVSVLAIAKPVIIVLFLANVIAVVFTLAFKRIFGFNLSNSLVLIIWRAVTFICGGLAAVSAFVAQRGNDPESFIPLIILLGGCGLAVIAGIVGSVLLKNRKTPVEEQRKSFRQRLLVLEMKLLRENYMINSWSKSRTQWRRLVKNVYEAHKNDRHVSSSVWSHLEIPPPPPPQPPEETYNSEPEPSTSEPLLPPPAYGDLFPNIMGPYGVPPPPYTASCDQVAIRISESTQVTPPQPLQVATEEHIPMTQPLPAEMRSNTLPRDDESSTGSTQQQQVNGVSEDFLDTSFQDTHSDDQWKLLDINSLECNGTTLLLIFENYIHYSAFSFSFMDQLSMWRVAVSRCDWTGLLHCLHVLEASLNGAFNSPTQVDVSLGNANIPLLELEPDIDTQQAPVYVPESLDPEVIRSLSDGERLQALADFRTVDEFGEQWAELLGKVLPTKPVIRRWSWGGQAINFHVYLRRAVQGVVSEVGPRGVKMARGAAISLPKHIQGRLSGSCITFVRGFEPKVKKGPVSVTVTELGLMKTEDKMYVTAQGKKLSYDRAVDTLKTVSWK